MSVRRVLMVIPSLNFGGAQRVFHGHSVFFSRRFEVTECVFNRDLGVAFPTAQKLESLDVDAGKGPAGKALKLGQRVSRLRALKRRLDVDVCVSHLEGADYVNLLSKGRERVILCVHGTKLHDANISGPLGAVRKHLLIPALYRRADHIVTVSRAIRHELIESFGLPGDRITAIPNGFDIAELEQRAKVPLEGELGALFERFPTVLTSGRLVVQKNQAELVEVFAKLQREVPDARLVFAGDGELRADLEARCKTLGLSVASVDKGQSPLSGAVVFLGFQDNPFKLISRCSVFALPSEWEGFPMAMGEAMACGAAVVSADCPTGPRELLSTGDPLPRALNAAEWTPSGALLPRLKGSDEARRVWSETLATLLRDADRRRALGRASRERVEVFGFEKLMERWQRVVEGLPVSEQL